MVGSPQSCEVIAGRYVLERPVGEGGNATVWRAVHKTLGRPVAVKFLTLGRGDPVELQKKFEREARVAAAVCHRNVVDILDFGTAEDGRSYMVMELLEGETLADRIAMGPGLRAAEVIRTMSRVLSGLAAVHDAGIVHRDLKPENVVLVYDEDGFYPKLLDFGLSRSVVGGRLEEITKTNDSVIAGTPHYMSPEQARGLPNIDRRSDIWAAGVMLYELLSGQLPFDEPHLGDLLVRIATEEPPELGTVTSHLHPAIHEVVDRALTREPAGRFRDARAMRDALLDAAGRWAKELEAEREGGGRHLVAAIGAMVDGRESGLRSLHGVATTPRPSPAPRFPGTPVSGMRKRVSSDHPTEAPASAGVDIVVPRAPKLPDAASLLGPEVSPAEVSPAEVSPAEVSPAEVSPAEVSPATISGSVTIGSADPFATPAEPMVAYAGQPEMPRRRLPALLVVGALASAAALVALWPSAETTPALRTETSAATPVAPAPAAPAPAAQLPATQLPATQTPATQTPATQAPARAAEPSPVAPELTAPETMVPEPPAHALVTLEGVPEGASIQLDGEAVHGPVVEIAVDGEAHLVEVSAEGRGSWRVTHLGATDVTHRVVLDPPREARRSSRRARSRREPVATPMDTGRFVSDPGF